MCPQTQETSILGTQASPGAETRTAIHWQKQARTGTGFSMYGSRPGGADQRPAEALLVLAGRPRGSWVNLSPRGMPLQSAPGGVQSSMAHTCEQRSSDRSLQISLEHSELWCLPMTQRPIRGALLQPCARLARTMNGHGLLHQRRCRTTTP